MHASDRAPQPGLDSSSPRPAGRMPTLRLDRPGRATPPRAPGSSGRRYRSRTGLPTRRTASQCPFRRPVATARVGRSRRSVEAAPGHLTSARMGAGKYQRTQRRPRSPERCWRVAPACLRSAGGVRRAARRPARDVPRAAWQSPRPTVLSGSTVRLARQARHPAGKRSKQRQPAPESPERLRWGCAGFALRKAMSMRQQPRPPRAPQMTGERPTWSRPLPALSWLFHPTGSVLPAAGQQSRTGPRVSWRCPGRSGPAGGRRCLG